MSNWVFTNGSQASVNGEISKAPTNKDNLMAIPSIPTSSKVPLYFRKKRVLARIIIKDKEFKRIEKPKLNIFLYKEELNLISINLYALIIPNAKAIIAASVWPQSIDL